MVDVWQKQEGNVNRPGISDTRDVMLLYNINIDLPYLTKSMVSAARRGDTKSSTLMLALVLRIPPKRLLKNIYSRSVYAQAKFLLN